MVWWVFKKEVLYKSPVIWECVKSHNMKAGTFICMYFPPRHEVVSAILLSASTVLCRNRLITMTLVNVNYLYNLYYSDLVISQHESEFNLGDGGCLSSILICICNCVQILSYFLRIKFQSHIIRLCKNSECSLDSVMQMKHHFMFDGVTGIIKGSIFWLLDWVLQSRQHHQSLYSSDVVRHTVNRAR